MKSTRQFILRTIVLRSSVLIPLLGGIASGVASWAVGGNLYLTALSIAGIAGSIAWMLTRTFLNVEELTEQALAAERQAIRQAEERQLDQLAKHLRTDRDHRTQDSLNLLRSLRDEFDRLTERPGFEQRSAQFRQQIGQLIQSSANQLQESYRLFERSEAVVGQQRQTVVEQRETIVVEVWTAVERLQKIVDQFRKITAEDQATDLTTIQKELEISLEIAKRTEQRMRHIENPHLEHQSFVNE